VRYGDVGSGAYVETERRIGSTKIAAGVRGQQFSLAHEAAVDPRIAAHVALGVTLVAIWQGIYAGYLRMAIGPFVWEKVYRGTWMFQLMNACLIYGGVVAGTLAVPAARRAREHERRQHALQLAARDAELRALAAQLEPHFLLNTLNSVIALIDDRPLDARVMLERLANLLRAAFDEIAEAEVPLGREIDLLSAYLGIEQVRFGDRPRVTIDVPDALRHVPVPPFLLQPVVENAVKHAVAPRSGPAFIAITARQTGDRVRIEVVDSGAGFEYTAAARPGHGLQLAERRLRAHAPSGEIGVDRTASGFAVFVTLPA
jgi:LytS/YehU family sensor histidine kinase